MAFEVNQEIIKKHRLQLYQAQPAQDVQLLRLWVHLTETEEIKSIFLPHARRLFKFLQTFQPPTVTAYALSAEDDIDFIAWFTPFESFTPASFVGIWSDKAIQGSRKLIELMGTVYEAAFTIWPQLLGVTHQKLIAQHQKMGYSLAGVVPGFYENEDGVTVFISKESFENSKVYATYRKLIGK